MNQDLEKPQISFKMRHGLGCTWMCPHPGNGELESEYQGRSAITSFSQETGVKKVQFGTRIVLIPALLRSAGCTMVSDSSSLFFNIQKQGQVWALA